MSENVKTYNQNNILLRISYDGTDFCGWQKQQKSGVETFRTVQGEIETALAKIHKQKTEIAGSGRTDSGVHAVGQIANFYSPYPNMQAANYVPALNSILPKDIRVMDAAKVEDAFHARFFSKARTYRYFCQCAPQTFAHETRYAWHIRYTPNLHRLNQQAALLRGELDFSTFAAAGDASKSKFRYIENAHFFMEGSKLVFEITANAFLWKMVRSLVGTLLEIEKKGGSPGDFQARLESGQRKNAGPTAPPHGLFLWEIRY